MLDGSSLRGTSLRCFLVVCRLASYSFTPTVLVRQGLCIYLFPSLYLCGYLILGCTCPQLSIYEVSNELVCAELEPKELTSCVHVCRMPR
jgi:hypothetical protein